MQQQQQQQQQKIQGSKSTDWIWGSSYDVRLSAKDAVGCSYDLRWMWSPLTFPAIWIIVYRYWQGEAESQARSSYVFHSQTSQSIQNPNHNSTTLDRNIRSNSRRPQTTQQFFCLLFNYSTHKSFNSYPIPKKFMLFPSLHQYTDGAEDWGQKCRRNE